MRTTDGLSRRSFLALAGAAPLVAATSSPLKAQFKNVPVGLELYSVRDEFGKDMFGTIKRVAGMGYQVVEFWAPYYQWTTDQVKEVRKVMDDVGLKCPSTHNSPTSFTPDGMQKAIDYNQILGSTKVVQSSAPANARTMDGWKAAVQVFTAATEKLRPLGMTAGFHNHASEWPAIDGQRPMEFLAANTPRDFVLQLDVGTCVEAGADPVAWIKANPGRIRSMHCKDWGAGAKGGYRVAFGEGDAPWKAIFAAAESVGGVEHYLVEQEVPGPDGSFAMAERCMANWKKLRA